MLEFFAVIIGMLGLLAVGVGIFTIFLEETIGFAMTAAGAFATGVAIVILSR